MSKKAIIVGASGLIGSALLAILLNDSEYSEVLALVRTPLINSNPKFNQIAVDFDKLDDYAHQITGDAIFCALGSTKRKTPDLNIYRKIDHDYPLKLAEVAVANGVNQFHLISSLGANKNSLNFYTKMKGETEADIKAVGLYSLVIYRPSLLTGDRKEHRFAEGLMQSLSKLVNPLLIGGLKKYRSIEASTVAKAMDNLSHTDLKGIYVYESDEISEAGLIY